MDIQGFLFAILPIALSPGASLTLAMSNTASMGLGGATRVILGTALGIFIHSLLAGIGISTFLIHNQVMMVSLNVVGLLFLMWLGIKLLFMAWNPSVLSTQFAHLVSVKQALYLNVFNVKAILLYLTVVPLFAGRQLTHYLVLSTIHCVIMVLWTYGCCLLLCLAKRQFSFTVLSQVINLTGGLSLVGMSINSALSMYHPLL